MPSESMHVHFRRRVTVPTSVRGDPTFNVNLVSRVKSMNYRFNFSILGRIIEGKTKCIGNQPLL
jgi:hypothetical protein